MEIRQCRRRVEYYTAAIEIDSQFLKEMNDDLCADADLDKFMPPIITEQMVRDSIEDNDEELNGMIFYFKGDFDCTAREWIHQYIYDCLTGPNAFELYDECDDDQGLEPMRVAEE